jgi:hypothetical protein
LESTSIQKKTKKQSGFLMENDLLESCKKLLTKGYTGIVVSDSNGLPVFGTLPLFYTLRHSSCGTGQIRNLYLMIVLPVKGACVSNSLGASGFSSSLVRDIFPV